VIHEEPDTADHEQPVGVVTSTLRLPPAAAMVCVDGVSVASQGAAAWVSTKAFPATVRVAERELLLLLAATT
jgi:hypothetical protein